MFVHDLSSSGEGRWDIDVTLLLDDGSAFRMCAKGYRYVAGSDELDDFVASQEHSHVLRSHQQALESALPGLTLPSPIITNDSWLVVDGSNSNFPPLPWDNGDALLLVFQSHEMPLTFPAYIELMLYNGEPLVRRVS